MSKYAHEPLSFQGLKTIPIQARGGKVRVEHFAKPYAGGGRCDVAGFAPAHSGSRFAALRGRRIGQRPRPQEDDPVGTRRPRHQVRPRADSDRSHAPRLRHRVRTERRRRDPRFRNRHRRPNQRRRRSRAARRQLRRRRRNRARIERGARTRDQGFGESLGRHLETIADPRFAASSLLCEAYRNSTPVTVHVAIGTDTPHTHPSAQRRGPGPRHAPRFPPALLAGQGHERRRRLSQRGLGRRAARSLLESRFGGAQSRPSAREFHHGQFRFPAALPAQASMWWNARTRAPAATATPSPAITRS